MPGTTTDPVSKAMEIPGIGPCLLIDTAGFDDDGHLGEMRVEKTKQSLEKTDIALLLFDDLDFSKETAVVDRIEKTKDSGGRRDQ